MKDILKFRSFDIAEHKSDDSGNMFISGYGAIFGNEDSYGDIIQPGAFAKTIAERVRADGTSRIAFCYQHDIWNPIGKIEEIKEDEKGLWISVMLSASEKDIQTKVREGILREMSIGYRTMGSREEIVDGRHINYLTEIKLIEVSLVTVAANPLALVEGMKGEEVQRTIENEFNRISAIVRNEKISFEIDRLKAIVITSLASKEQPQEQPEQTMTKDDYLKLLLNN
jgi:HK97 family phage prohead protease